MKSRFAFLLYGQIFMLACLLIQSGAFSVMSGFALGMFAMLADQGSDRG